MEENNNITEVVAEIKNADENTLRETVEKWFSETRTMGMRVGARYMAAGVYSIINKHLNKASKKSLRDYERMTNALLEFVSVQLRETEVNKDNDMNSETVQNDLAEGVSNDE